MASFWFMIYFFFSCFANLEILPEQLVFTETSSNVKFAQSKLYFVLVSKQDISCAFDLFAKFLNFWSTVVLIDVLFCHCHLFVQHSLFLCWSHWLVFFFFSNDLSDFVLFLLRSILLVMRDTFLSCLFLLIFLNYWLWLDTSMVEANDPLFLVNPRYSSSISDFINDYFVKNNVGFSACTILQ